MRLAVFSDLHLHNYKPFSYPMEELSSRAYFGLHILHQISDLVEQQNLKATLFCGDFWETQGYVSVPLYLWARGSVAELCRQAPVFAIGGNHDAATRIEDPSNAIEMFSDVDGFHHLDETGPQHLIQDGIGVEVWGVSAQRRLRKWPESNAPKGVTETMERRYRILLLHETIKGTQISPTGWIADKGLDLDELNRYLDDNRVDLCLVGDIHLRQQVDERIWYVGNAIQKSFGEDQEKGMLIVELSEAGVAVEFHRLDSPQFVTLSGEEIDSGRLNDYDFFRLEPESRAQYEALSRDYESKFNVRLIPFSREQERSARMEMKSSIEDTLRDWVKLTADKPDRSRLVKLGLEIMGGLK